MSKYKFSDTDFIETVKSSFSIAEVLRKFGLSSAGGSYRFFHIRVKKLSIDTSHFTGERHLKGKNHSWTKRIPLSELLIVDSNRVLSINLKKRLINEGILIEKCNKCQITNIWQGEPITLQIDHINGDHFDHRLENLRLLCPNCHSQTPTFCSKNIKANKYEKKKSVYIPQEQKKCVMCNAKLKDGRRTFCKNCYNLNRSAIQMGSHKTKIIWPTIEELKSKLEKQSYLALGKELGISDNAIRKHIEKYQERK